MIGSPLYMSPEQLESPKDVDGRTDIWSLGIVLFELITGRTPFVADTLAQLTHQVLSAQAPTCASLGVQVPEGLEQVIARALSKRRDARYSSVADLARALVPYGPVHGAVSAARAARMQPGSSAARSGVLRASALGAQIAQGAPARAASTEEPPVHSTSTPTAWERRPGMAAGKRRIAWIALAAVVVLAAVALILRVALLGPSAAGTASPAAATRGEHTLPAQGIKEHSVRPSVAAPEAKPAAEPLPPPAAANVEAAALPAKAPEAKPPAPAATPVPAVPKVAIKAAAPPPPARVTTKPPPGPPEPAGKSPVINITDFGGRR